jgi:hypothetical protein
MGRDQKPIQNFGLKVQMMVFPPHFTAKTLFLFLAFTQVECTEVHAMAPLTLRKRPVGRRFDVTLREFGHDEEKKSLTAGMANIVVQLTALSLYWPAFGHNAICFLF